MLGTELPAANVLTSTVPGAGIPSANASNTGSAGRRGSRLKASFFGLRRPGKRKEQGKGKITTTLGAESPSGGVEDVDARSSSPCSSTTPDEDHRERLTSRENTNYLHADAGTHCLAGKDTNHSVRPATLATTATTSGTHSSGVSFDVQQLQRHLQERATSSSSNASSNGGEETIASHLRKSLSWCAVCGRAVQPDDERAVVLRDDRGLVHEACFLCSSCHRPLVLETYRHDQDKRLYCSKHHGGYAQLGSALSLPRSVARASRGITRAGAPGSGGGGGVAVGATSRFGGKGGHQRARSFGGLLATSPTKVQPHLESAANSKSSSSRGTEGRAANGDQRLSERVTSSEAAAASSRTTRSSELVSALDDQISPSKTLGEGSAAALRPDAGTENVEGVSPTHVFGSTSHTRRRSGSSAPSSSSLSGLSQGQNKPQVSAITASSRSTGNSSSGAPQAQSQTRPGVNLRVKSSSLTRYSNGSSSATTAGASATSSSSSASPSPLKSRSSATLPARPESTSPVPPPVAARTSKFGHFIRGNRTTSTVKSLIQKVESSQTSSSSAMKSSLPVSSRPPSSRSFGARSSETSPCPSGRTTPSALPKPSTAKANGEVENAAEATTKPKSSIGAPRGTSPRSRLPGPPTAAKPGQVTPGGIPMSGSRCTVHHHQTTSQASGHVPSTASQRHLPHQQAMPGKSAHTEIAQQHSSPKKAILSPRNSFGASASSPEHAPGRAQPSSAALKPGSRQGSSSNLSSRLQSPSRSNVAAAAGSSQMSPKRLQGIPAPASGGKSKIRPAPISPGGKRISSQENISGASSRSQSPPSPRGGGGEDRTFQMPSLPKSPLARSSSAGANITSPSHGRDQHASAENPGVSSLTRRGMLLAAKYKQHELDEEEQTSQRRVMKSDGKENNDTDQPHRQLHSANKSKTDPRKQTDGSRSGLAPPTSTKKKRDANAVENQSVNRESPAADAPQKQQEQQQEHGKSTTTTPLTTPEHLKQSVQRRENRLNSLPAVRESYGSELREAELMATHSLEKQKDSKTKATSPGASKLRKNASNASSDKNSPPRACLYKEELPNIIDDSFLDDLQMYKAMCQDVVEQFQAQEDPALSGALQSRLSRQRSPSSTVSSTGSASQQQQQIQFQLRNEDFQPAGAAATSSDDWTTQSLIAVACGYYSEPLKSVEYSNSFHRHSVRRNSSKRRRRPSLKPTCSGTSLSDQQQQPAGQKATSPSKSSISYYAIEAPLEEAYKTYFVGQTHWNYYLEDDGDIGACVLSLKQESSVDQERFRVLVRSANCILHGCLPATSLLADPYVKEEVVASIGREIGITDPFSRTTHPSAEQELLRIDESFNSRQMKIGLVYVAAGQTTEEEMFNNRSGGSNFEMFMSLLGDRVKLYKFGGYRGGLDVEFSQTGDESLYSEWHDHQVMFHVAPLLPHHETDRQQVQKKRHIGNDMVLVVFVDDDVTQFNPTCIRSHFLHTFVVVHHSNESYRVDVVARESVPLFGPPLYKKNVFPIKTDYEKEDFREFFMTKLVNAYRASLKAPKFLAMKTRTTSQMLSELSANFASYEAQLGEYRPPLTRGISLASTPNVIPSCSPSRSSAWVPSGARRMSTPLPERSKKVFTSLDGLGRDLHQACRDFKQCCDVSFIVGDRKYPLPAVRAILVVRSAAFRKYFLEPSNAMPTSAVSDSVPSIDADFSATSSDLASLALEGANDPPLARKGLRASARFKLRGQQQRKNSNLSVKSQDSGPGGVQRQARVKPVNRRKSSSKSVASSNNLFWGETNSNESGTEESGGLERSLSWQNLRPSSSTPHLLDDCGSEDGQSGSAASSHGGGASGCGRSPPTHRIELPTPSLDSFLRQLAPGIPVFEVSEFSEESFSAVLDYVHAGTCEVSAFALPGVLCAASVLGLEALEGLCFKWASRLLIDAPSCIQMLVGMEAYYRRHPFANRLFENVLVPFILERGAGILTEPTLTNLGQESMRRLYALRLPTDDTTRFRAAASWAEAESHRQMTAVERGTRSTNEVLAALQEGAPPEGQPRNPSTSSSIGGGDSLMDAESTLAECSRESLRKQLIAPLVRDVSLRKISAADLMKLVLPTGAFPPDQVMMALAFQADPTAAAYFGVGDSSPNARGHGNARKQRREPGRPSGGSSTPQPGGHSTTAADGHHRKHTRHGSMSSATGLSDGESGGSYANLAPRQVTKGGSLSGHHRRQYSASPSPSSPAMSTRSGGEFFNDDSNQHRLTPSPTRSRRRLQPSSLGRSSGSLSPRRPSIQNHPHLGGDRSSAERLTASSSRDVTKCETPPSAMSATSPPPFFDSPDIPMVAETFTAQTTIPTENVPVSSIGKHSQSGKPDLDEPPVCPPSPSRLTGKRGSSSSGGTTSTSGSRLRVTAL